MHWSLTVTPTPSTPLAARLWLLGERAIGALKLLQPLALLAARLYVASVFFRSGLTKLRDWDITLSLFADEYHVPLLNPTVAAFMGTGAELALPVLLVLGLFGRFAAAGLTILNIVAARIVSTSFVNENELVVVLGLGADGAGARLLARVTRQSWERLALAVDQLVYAQVKAVALT